MTDDELISLIPLEKENTKLANEILAETDIARTQELTHLFNLNQAKRNAIRVLKLNSLWDKISDQMVERFEKRPGEFSNTDLLNYLNTVQNSIERANKSLTGIDETPAIKINVENVNVNEEPVLDRESRERISAALKAIMKLTAEQKENATEEVIVDEPEFDVIKEESANDSGEGV